MPSDAGAFHYLVGTVAFIPGRHLPQFFAQVVVRRTGKSRNHHARANIVDELRGLGLRNGPAVAFAPRFWSDRPAW